MFGAIVNEPIIHFVGDRQHIVLLAELGDQLQLGARVDLAGRVVRRVDKDQLWPSLERGAQLGWVEPPRRPTTDDWRLTLFLIGQWSVVGGRWSKLNRNRRRAGHCNIGHIRV